jgi:hypothetical protein
LIGRLCRAFRSIAGSARAAPLREWRRAVALKRYAARERSTDNTALRASVNMRWFARRSRSARLRSAPLGRRSRSPLWASFLSEKDNDWSAFGFPF